jgi:hypothetical protein
MALDEVQGQGITNLDKRERSKNYRRIETEDFAQEQSGRIPIPGGYDRVVQLCWHAALTVSPSAFSVSSITFEIRNASAGDAKLPGGRTGLNEPESRLQVRSRTATKRLPARFRGATAAELRREIRRLSFGLRRRRGVSS